MQLGKALVRGFSMVPALGDADELVVNYGAPYKVGDVIVFDHQGRIDIKRVAGIDDDGVFVVGDNEVASLDSRKYGPIDPKTVLGKAIFRIHPFGRIPKKGQKVRRRLRRRPKRHFTLFGYLLRRR